MNIVLSLWALEWTHNCLKHNLFVCCQTCGTNITWINVRQVAASCTCSYKDAFISAPNLTFIWQCKSCHSCSLPNSGRQSNVSSFWQFRKICSPKNELILFATYNWMRLSQTYVMFHMCKLVTVGTPVKSRMLSFFSFVYEIHWTKMSMSNSGHSVKCSTSIRGVYLRK